MKSVRSITGMPVIMHPSGARAGRVGRVVLNGRLDALDGLWVTGRLGGRKYLAAEDIELIGDYSVLAKRLGRRSPEGDAFGIRRAVDMSGSLVGAVVGAYIGKDDLRVTGIEVSKGFFEDIFRLREVISNYAARPSEGDVIIFDEGEMDYE